MAQLEPFPGYPLYLESAAQALGHPEAAGPARRVSTLAALANLCAQASIADSTAVPAILAKAEEFRDQLRIAAHAAELMLASVRRTRAEAADSSTPEATVGPTAGRGSPPPSRQNSQHPGKGRHIP